MKPIVQSFLVMGLFLINPASAGLLSKADANPVLPCKAKSFVKDELYFGLLKPDGRNVTIAEWQQFLNQVITPRFQEGLTVSDTYGQYLNRSGRLVIERSKLVVLIYESGEARERAIEAIIAAHKTKFHQESVLRVTTCVQATF